MPKKYNNQFKQDVLAFWSSNPTMSVKQVCRDFGITPTSLYEWRKQSRNSAGDGFQVSQDSGVAVSFEEHRRLQRRNLELEQENLVLKRAAAYFAKDSLPKGSTLSS